MILQYDLCVCVCVLCVLFSIRCSHRAYLHAVNLSTWQFPLSPSPSGHIRSKLIDGLARNSSRLNFGSNARSQSFRPLGGAARAPSVRGPLLPVHRASLLLLHRL